MFDPLHVPSTGSQNGTFPFKGKDDKTLQVTASTPLVSEETK